MTTNTEFQQRYGPCALVTGASSGIGLAFAELLATRGLDLVLVARREQRLQKLAEKLRSEHGIDVRVLSADLSDSEGIATIVVETEGMDIGLLISNAGFGLKGPHQLHPPKQLSEMLTVNCQAPMWLSHAFIPRLLQRGKGGILFTSSVEGFIGFPYSAAYAATKGFVNNLGEALWGELHPQGIDVLNLCPSSTDTEALDKQGIDKSQLDLMSPAEVAQIGLAALADGPTIIAGEQNRQMVEGSLAMPRREALAMMADAMQAAIKP